MNLNMTFRQMTASDAIKFYTREKSERLKKYFRGKITVTWNFSVVKKDHIAHCHLVGNNMDYFGEATTEDLHGSIDQAVEKIEKQLRKHKEIVKDHLHASRTGEAGEVLAPGEDETPLPEE
jgi:putative sigma-54 modulation protein